VSHVVLDKDLIDAGDNVSPFVNSHANMFKLLIVDNKLLSDGLRSRPVIAPSKPVLLKLIVYLSADWYLIRILI